MLGVWAIKESGEGAMVHTMAKTPEQVKAGERLADRYAAPGSDFIRAQLINCATGETLYEVSRAEILSR